MRILLLGTVFGITAFFMTGCATMIGNSYGFDHNSQREEIMLRRDMRPEWFKNDNDRRDWEGKNNENGTIRFFYAENTRTPAEVEASGLTVWSVNEASSQAFQDLLVRIAFYIDSKTTGQIGREGSITTEEEVRETQTTGRRTTNAQAQEKFSSKIESKSAASYRGLDFKELYTETWVQEIKKKRITITKVWMVYGITEANIQEALREASKRESLEKKEEIRFEELAWEYKIAIEGLNRIDFSKPESEKQLKEKYDELNHISNALGTLSTLKKRGDAIGQEYVNLIANIANDISKINPTDRHFTIIENLQRQVFLKQSEIDGILASRSAETRVDLERTIADKDALIEQIITGRQGYSIRSQTYILSFPQKPNETLVSTVHIYAANEMISNMDYISFVSIHGRNSFSRGDYGLNSPATSVNWNEAALYCNWLSRLYGYIPCYTESNEQITGYDRTKNGYRLPERDEIIAMLDAQSGIINEIEFKKIGIWSSDDILSEPTVYIIELFGNLQFQNNSIVFFICCLDGRVSCGWVRYNQTGSW